MSKHFIEESNLSKDFKDFRNVQEVAVNRDMLVFQSESKLVSDFQNMLNSIVKVSQNVLSDDNMDANEIHAHVIGQMIIKMMDNAALALSEQGNKSVIFLSDCREVKKKNASIPFKKQSILVELIVDSVLRSQNKFIIGLFGAQLFDLSLLMFILNE